ncbi:hypothetical protein [Puia dinghuensis]|uniref:Uncharacterized protein n=1 Tax=Puia dinghuensis TaxID=1792502 RepID=A0A8J2UGF6_9BACT|nr:hypothetical protein [Puia dinghuensis]GGB13849.1 hypothetical protein GCM10011511_41980 [Puia dinghuensis]
MMNNGADLEQCKRLIETSLGWGDAATWTNEDFDTLSDRIFEKTSVRLSISTLKRIWGKVRYDSSPTTATLNALARYAGFEGWRDFMATTQPPAKPSPAHEAPPAPQKSPTRRFITPLIIITITFAVLISFISARIIHPPAANLPLRFDHRATSDELPNSVVFDYDATPMHPKTVMIQQAWDPKRREKVDPYGKQHTSIYYYPGYFRSKLIVDGELKMQSDVFIPTKGWKAIIIGDPLPIYLSAAETTLDSGRLSINAATLQAKTGSPVFNSKWTGFFDVHQFAGISGDHFLLRTTVRNTSTVEQCLCRNVSITVMGKLSAIIFPLTDRGCISDIGLYTGFTGVSGKDHDLSAFGCDFSQWQQIVCAQKDQTLDMWLNGRLIYTKPGNRSIGDIVGIRIGFEGTGEIKEATLQGGGVPQDLLKQP